MPTVITKYYDYNQQDLDYLISVDEVLGAAITQLGKVERVIIPDLFCALIHAIVGQLISVKAANTVWGRIQEQFGEISAQNLSMQASDDIQKCGMTMKKAVCIHTISQMIVQGNFNLDELHDLSD